MILFNLCNPCKIPETSLTKTRKRLAFSTVRTLSGLVSFAILLLVLCQPARAIDGPVLQYIEQLAERAMAANRANSQSQMESILRENVDIQHVGRNSLGSYVEKLPSTEVDSYFDGVLQFMSRYAAQKSRDYKILNVKFRPPQFRHDGIILVRSKITLASGSTYSIKWKLRRQNGRLKVMDAGFFGFWLVPMQRRLFQNYIRRHNHDVNALLFVLAQ